MIKKYSKSILIVYALVMGLLCAGIFMFWGKIKATTYNKLGVEWYDEDGKEFTITTADELYELAALSDFYTFEGQTIRLGADIVVNEGNAKDWGETPPSKKWYPISGFAGKFDGQGHTISGLYGTGIDTAMALFSNTDKYCEVYDFKLVNSRFETKGTGGTASIFTGGGGNFARIYSDAIVSCTSDNCGGFASRVTRQAVLDECWFDGEVYTTSKDCGGMVDFVDSCTLTIKHSLCSGDVYSTYSLAGTRTGGFCGKVGTGAVATQLILEDSLYSGKMDMARATYSGSAVGVYYAASSVSAKNTYVANESYEYVMGQSGAQGKLEGAVTNYGISYLTGFQSYMWTNLDFQNYWAVVEDDTPILKYFAEDVPDLTGVQRVYDTSWYSDMEDTFELNTKEELYGLYMLSAGNTFDGKTIKLGSDIVLNEGKAEDWKDEPQYYMWFPIVNFAGEFDGQGHSISGIYLDTSNMGAGFFAKTDPLCKISNLKITNAYMTSSATGAANLGSLVGYGAGTFTNIYSDAVLNIENAAQGGGLVGVTNGALKMKNCWFDGSLSHYNDTGLTGNVGGILGLNSHNLEMESCLFSGKVTSRYINMDGTQAAWRAAIGGILGRSMNKMKLSDSASTGTVYVSFEKNPELDYTDKAIPKNVVSVGSVVGYVASDGVLKDNYGIEGNAKTKVPDSEPKIMEAIGEKLATKEISGGAVSLGKERMTDYNAYRWTTLNFADAWAVVKNDTPILKCFATKVPSLAGVKKSIDVSWYNKEPYVIKTKAQLYGLAIMLGADDFEGKTVSLGADITLNNGTVDSWIENDFKKLDNWMPLDNFKGTFNGNGHTISGLYLNTEMMGKGMFSTITETTKICNLSLENSYLVAKGVENLARIGSIVGNAAGGSLQNVYSNAVVKTIDGLQVGGLVGFASADFTMEGCWFDGEVYTDIACDGNIWAYTGGLIGQTAKHVILKNCLYTGHVDVTYMKDTDISATAINAYVGGFVGRCSTTADVSGCLGSGTINVVWKKNPKLTYTDTEPSIIGAVASLFGAVDSALTTKDVYDASIVTTKAGSNKEVNVTAINKGKSPSQKIIRMNSELLLGVNGYRHTTLDFSDNGAWVAVDNKVPALKYFAGKVTPVNVTGVSRLVDFDWYNKYAGTAEDAYILSDKEDLYGFTIASQNDTFHKKTVKLKGNSEFKLNEGSVADWENAGFVGLDNWIPISRFAGTFDGQGSTISGLYLNTKAMGTGLFAASTNISKICNLSLKNTYMVSEGVENVARIGSIVGNAAGGIMQNVYSNAVIKTIDGLQVGGLVGFSSADFTMEGCWFDGDIFTNIACDGNIWAYTGGLIGQSGKAVVLKNCLYTGDVDVTYMKDTDVSAEAINAYVGGFIGRCSTTADVSGSLGSGTVRVEWKKNPNLTYTNTEPTTVGAVASLIGAVDKTFTAADVYDASIVTTKAGTNKEVNVTAINKGTAPSNKIIRMDSSFLLGANGYKYTTLDFSNNGAWVAVDNKVPALRYFTSGNVVNVANMERLVDYDWYNAYKGTAEDAYILSDKDDLYGFAMASQNDTFANKTVKLKANTEFKLNTGNVDTWKKANYEGLNNWAQILKFAGTFDGQGSVISGLYLNTDAKPAGFFKNTTETAKICNFSLKNSYLVSTFGPDATIGSIVGNAGGSMENVYSNAVIETTQGFKVGGLLGSSATAYTMKGCWFDGDIVVNYAEGTSYGVYAGGLIGQAAKALTLEDCLYTGELDVIYMRTDANADTTNTFVGGLVGRCSDTSNISNCVGAGAVNVAWKKNPDVTYGSTSKAPTTINRVAGLIGQADKNVTVANVYNATDVNKQAAENIVIHVIDAFEFQSTSVTASKNVLHLERPMLIGKGVYQCTELDFDNTWTAVSNELPALKYFEKNGIDLSNEKKWYDDGYVIDSKEDLYGFVATSQSDNFAGKTVKLGADIVLNEGTVEEWKANNFANLENWIPINNFAGTFDGQGYSISGLYLTTATKPAGFFGSTTTSSVICDFSLEDSYLVSTFAPDATIGSIVGNAGGSMENVYSNATVETTQGFKAGGLVGATAAYTMKGCWYDGDLIVNYTEPAANNYGVYAGGFIAQATGALVLQNCMFTGNVTANYMRQDASYDTYGFRVGGFVGRTHSTVTMTNCISDGNVMAYWKKYPDASIYTVSGAKVPTTLSHVASLIGQTASAPTSSNVQDFNTVITQAEGKDAVIIAAGNELAAYGWYHEANGDEKTPYVINNSKDLYGFAIVSKIDTFSGKTVKLGEDNIPLNAGTVAEWKTNSFANLNNWIPINNFAGTFDGNGKTVSGLYLTQDTNCVGMFGKLTTSAKICNLYLKESYLQGNATPDARIGSIVGWFQGGTLTLENVYSNAEVVASKGMSAGGLVGYCHTNGPLVLNGCWFDGKLSVSDESAYEPYAGGMVGQTANNLTMTNCLYTGVMNVVYKGTKIQNGALNAYVGGFAGCCSGKVSVTECISAGTVSFVWEKNPSVTTTATTAGAVGGLFGDVKGTFTVSKAYNAATTTTKVWDNATTTVTKSHSGSTPNEAISPIDKTLLVGDKAKENTTLNFSKGWASVSDGMPIPIYFSK